MIFFSSLTSCPSQYLTEKADEAMAVQGVKYLRKIAEHPAWAQWVDKEVSPGPNVQSDEDILE